MSDSGRLYKWVFVIALVALSVAYITPPDEKLKGGIDLVGGSSLLFEIDTTGLKPEEQRGLSTQVMAILKERVDPGARLNLEWRPVGNTRLEIRMPMPPQEVGERREARDAALAAVQKLNVDRFEVEEALNAGADERAAQLQALERGVAERAPLLTELQSAYDAYQASLAEGDPLVIDDAQQRYERAVEALMQSNLPVARLRDVLSIENKETRQQELNKLTGEYPSYNSQANGKLVDAAVEKYDEWEKDRADLEDPADLKRRLKGAGVLEFRILATRDSAKPTHIAAEQAELREEIAKYADQLARYGPRPQAGDHYAWFPVHDLVDFMNLEGPEEFERVKDMPGRAVVQPYAGQYYVLSHTDPGFGLTAGRGVSGGKWSLRGAVADRDYMTGQNIVRFQLDPRGGNQFGEVTRNNLHRQLCIFLDGEAMSHATIQSEIREHGQISGRFTQQEVFDLARTLQAGALPARLKETPLMEKTVGPALGETNRNRGMQATVLGLAVVVVFMLVYYGIVAGGMADVAVLLNLLFILAAMAITQATFTLPGIAGVILTVGMAVDANVLIFERVREERERGVVFRKALNAGYDKAFSTILDANLTTLITCVVLGFLGSEEVKGFATTLGVGITTSMFTSLFVTRLVFNTLIGAGWLKDFSMRRIIGVPTIDWLALRATFWPISTCCVVGGVVVFALVSSTNREALYDIEFLGGTSVQIDLRPGIEMTDEEVREDITSTTADSGSAVAWLRSAADALESASVSAGELAGQLQVSSETLTGQEMADLTSTVLERALERNGVHPERRSVTFDIKPGELDSAGMKQRLAEAATLARRAADNLRNARVQSVSDLTSNEAEPILSFEIVTVETNRPIVQAAIVAALGDNLRIERALSYGLREDEELTGGSYFAVEDDDQYLSDVLGGDVASYNVRRFQGGVVFDVSLDEKEEPIAREEVERRLREVGLLPEFEDYAMRPTEVFPLGAGAERNDGRTGYRRFAVAAVDPALRFGDDPLTWEEQLAQVQQAQLEGALGHTKSLSKVTNFEPQIAGQVQQQAIFAVAIALLAIVAYVWLRFGTAQFGLAAIVALVHDVAITLGLVTLSHYLYATPIGWIFELDDFKIDLAMMAAILTVIGYSLNDTIVVFDRIRENRGRLGALSPVIINNSLNQTLSRTLLTSVTTLLVVLCLYVFGGRGVHGFAFALLIGVFVGTYSSLAIATPLLYRPKVLVHVVLLIVLAGVLGTIYVMTRGTTTHLVLSAIALVLYAVMAVRAQRGGLISLAPAAGQA